MDIAMVTAAEDVKIEPSPQGQKINIIRLVQDIGCGRVPCRVPRIVIVVGFSADAMEFGQQPLVKCELVAPDAAIVATGQQTCTIPHAPQEGTRSFFHAIFPFAPVVFRQLGPHSFRISIDELHAGDVPVYVR